MDRPFPEVRAALEALLATKGYRHAVVLGPFAGRAGEEEYAVTLGDSRRRPPATERGTYEALRDWIATLPGATPPGPPAATPPGRGDLEALLLAKGYAGAAVLGPFAGHAGPPEYTVTLDVPGAGQAVTRRGTPAQLQGWIAGLPRQGARRRRPGPRRSLPY